MKYCRATIAALVLAMAGAAPARAGAYEDFFEAVRTDDARTVEALVLRGISTNSADRKHGPAIVLAARERAHAALRALLLSPATDLDARNAAGESALMYAALHGDVENLKLLIAKGAAVNQPGWTALHYAASAGQVEAARLLLEHSAYIDAASENGTTPLMLAARQKQLTVAQLLVREGADPSLRNEGGYTAADYLERNGLADDAKWMRAQADAFLRRYGTRERPVPAAPATPAAR